MNRGVHCCSWVHTLCHVLQARLWQVGKLLPRGLAQHMELQGALPVLYASSWLLTAFASDFPLFFASRVMDVVLADCYLEPMMKVPRSGSTCCTACASGMVLQCTNNLRSAAGPRLCEVYESLQLMQHIAHCQAGNRLGCSLATS